MDADGSYRQFSIHFAFVSLEMFSQLFLLDLLRIKIKTVQLPEPPSTGLKSSWWARTVRSILAIYYNNNKTQNSKALWSYSEYHIIIVRVSSSFSSSSQLYPRIYSYLSGNKDSSHFLPVHILDSYHASGSALLPHVRFHRILLAHALALSTTEEENNRKKIIVKVNFAAIEPSKLRQLGRWSHLVRRNYMFVV